MDFGERLTRLRESKGLSQYEVATRLGIKRPRYNAWEQGISKPRADMVNKVAEFFEVNPNFLLGFDRENESTPEWATSKDKRDLNKYLEDMGPLFYKGIEFSEEDKAKMIGVAESIFWDAKQKNKQAYKKSRQKKKDNNEE